MAQPIFPGIEDIMTILLGEMPAGPYAQDRADNPNTMLRSISSSEIRAHAQVFANLYANLQDIDQNKFLTTVNPDEIGNWEQELFTTVVDTSQSFATRQQNALSKYRARGGLSYPYIYSIISSVLTPLGLTFDLVTYNCFNSGTDGVWILDMSLLDVGTYLGLDDPLTGAVQNSPYILDCNAIINVTGTTTNGSPIITAVESTSGIGVGAPIVGAGIPSGTTVLSTTTSTITMSQNATISALSVAIQIQNYVLAGLTAQEYADIQTVAYTYEVRIYGNASAATLTTLDQLLTQNEKATVTHVIINNFPPPIPGPIPGPIDGTLVDMGPFTGDTLIDNINCGLFLTLPVTYDNWDFGAFV